MNFCGGISGAGLVCCSCGNERGAHGDAKRFNTGHQRPAPEIFPRPSFSRHSFTTSHQQRQQKPAPEIPPPPKFSIEAQRGREVWICPECTYENSLACSHCTMCNTSKGKITYSQPHIEYWNHSVHIAESSLAATATNLSNSTITSVDSQPSLPQDSVKQKHSLTVQEVRRLDEDKSLAVWMTIVDEHKRVSLSHSFSLNRLLFLSFLSERW